MNLFIKDDSSLMRIEDEMCSRNVTDRVVHTVDRCRRVPWITRPSFTISSLWRTTKWNPRISWKDLSLSRDVGEKKKKRILSEPARSIQQAFKLSTDPLAKRDDRPVFSTVCLADSASYALSFQCLFDIYLGMLSVLASAHTTVEYLTVPLAEEFLEYRWSI